MTLDAGNLPVVIETRKGVKHFYWIDGTDVKGQVRDYSDNVLKDTFTAITGVDEDTGIAVDESYTAEGFWRIGMLYTKDSALKFSFSLDGVSFA